MALKLIGTTGIDADTKAGIAEAKRMAEDADAKAANARQMVLNDRERNATTIAELREAAAQLPTTQAGAAAAHLALQQQIDETLRQVEAVRADLTMIELTPGPQGPAGDTGPQGLRGPSGVDGVQGERGPVGPAGERGLAGERGSDGIPGVKGDAGPAGTANLAVGARPVGLLALGGSTDVVVPLSRAMTGTAYNVQAAHSAVVDLSGVTLTVKTRTATAVTITVKATGVALVAGTLVVVAF